MALILKEKLQKKGGMLLLSLSIKDEQQDVSANKIVVKCNVGAENILKNLYHFLHLWKR